MANSSDKQLFEYCKDGKTQLLLDALATVYDYDIFDERGNSLLSIALKNGCWDTASHLIEKDFICALEPIALIAACQYRDDESQGINIALESNPNINTQNPQRRTALMTSCLLGHYKKSKELIDKNANCELVDADGNTALIDAIRAKNLKIIEIILAQNINVNHVNNDGDTALHVAIKQKTPLESVLVALLDAGANPELNDINNKSTWLIAKQKHVKLSRLIERHLNKINQIELPFFTNDYTPEKEEENKIVEEKLPIEASVRENRIESMMALSSEQKSNKTRNTDIENIQKSTLKVFDFKHKKQTKSNAQEWFYAAKKGNLGGLNRMIIGGVDINCVDDKGCSALIRACGHSRRAVVSFLLQQNADIELRSKNGSTALSSSVIGNCRRVAGLLLERGANPNGLGPLDYNYVTIAAAQWNDAMLSILYRNDADVFVLNKHKQNLIHIIALGAEYNHNINTAKSSIQFLLDHGLDLNAQDTNGNTAIMILCGSHIGDYNGEDRDIASIVHFLLKSGAKPAITNSEGESAIDATRLHQLQQTKGVLMNALSWND